MNSQAFVEAVRKTSSLHRMDLSRVLVLVSGGPDSVALLRVLLDLGNDPAVLHVDHGLRGEESREDADFVLDLCESLGVRCEMRRTHFPDASNLQERAREERYRLAGEVARNFGASAIATGHTADDVAETVLLNLSRGSGLRGVSGIPPKRGNIVRPLLERGREEILAYLESLGQPYRTDSTNLTTKYARNRLRLEVMPLLEDMYPGASRNLARAARLAREDLETLEGLSAEAIEERENETAVILDRLAGGHPALLRHAVRMACESVAPDASPLEHSLVQIILELAEKEDGTRGVDLPGGVVAVVRFGREVAFYRPGDCLGDLEAGEKEISSGEILFDGWSILVREVGGFDGEDAARGEVAYLDAARGPYRVRLAREGDTIRPLGLGGTKKVLRAMMDRKVPKDLRRRVPVVVGAGGEVAWVFCGELGEEFAVGRAAEKILRLEVRRV